LDFAPAKSERQYFWMNIIYIRLNIIVLLYYHMQFTYKSNVPNFNWFFLNCG